MQLSNIKEFLEVYRKKLSHEDDKRTSLIQIIKETSGVTINEKDMTVARGVISIKAGHVVKNEIFLYKEKIIAQIHASGRTDIFDIK